MFETVIVPLDGSELAEAAIEPAREIAEKGTFNGLQWTGAPLDLNGLFR